MKPVRLAPEAFMELADAATWYESRSPGLARRFLSWVSAPARLVVVPQEIVDRVFNTLKIIMFFWWMFSRQSGSPSAGRESA
jgi:hypothetical protein